MNYKTIQVKGKGRGKLLGYPTINLEIPSMFIEDEGIYASWVMIEDKKYKGALHFGPVPTFGEKAKSLEVFLIGADEKKLRNLKASIIEIVLVKKIRDILSFSNPKDLSQQITMDVEEIDRILASV
ncbi:riboflavin kinase [Candidatus Roizmanbacteria bacterium]|nr:riboflavin kinase [Candidatus Roizmanbacteria bacterium]